MSISDDFIKKHLGETASSNQKSTSGKTGGETSTRSVADDFIRKFNYDVDETFINTFLFDANRFSSSANADYSNLEWGNASSHYDRRQKDWADLNYRQGIVRGWLDSNKDRLNADAYKSLAAGLDTFSTDASSIMGAFKAARDIYSKYNSQEEYDTAVRQYGWQQKYQGKGYFEMQELLGDLEEGSEEYKWLSAYSQSVITPEETDTAIAKAQRAIDSGWKYLEDYGELASKYNHLRSEMTEDELAMAKVVLDKYGSFDKMEEAVRKSIADNEKVLFDMKNAKANAKRHAELTGGYDPSKHQAQGQAGWAAYNKYVEDSIRESEERRKAQESKEEEKTFGDYVLEFLSSMGQSPDTSLPLHIDVNQASKEIQNKDLQLRSPKDNWTDEQRETFGYLWENNRQKSYEYAYAVNTALAEQAEQEEIAKIQNWSTQNIGTGILGTAGAIATAPFGLADYVYDMLEYGSVGHISEGDGNIAPFEFSQAVTSGISNKLNGVDEFGVAQNVLPENIPIIGGKGWGDVYGLTTSILQSSAAVATGGSGQALITFFGPGAAAGVDDAIKRGATGEQALFYGASLGTAEALAENIGLDNLLKMGSSATAREFLWNLFKQGGIESLEEGVTTGLGEFADRLIMGDKSNFYLRYEAYRRTGISDEEAKHKAWGDFAEDVAFDMLGGFVSGEVHAGTHTAINNFVQNKYAQTETGRDIMDLDGGVNSLMMLADDMAGVTTGKEQKNLMRQVEKVSAKVDKGSTSNRTARKVAKLYDMVKGSLSTQNHADIVKALTKGENGFSSKDANKIAGALVAMSNGLELTEAQADLLNSVKSNPAVHGIMESINSDKTLIGQRNQQLRDFTHGVTVNRMKNIVTRQVAEKEFTPEGVYETSSGNKAIRTDTNEEIDIKRVKDIGDGKLILELADGSEIDAKSVSFANEADALIYEAVGKLGDNINAERATQLIAQFKGGDAMVFARGIAQAYTYGFYGIDKSELFSKHSLADKLTEEQREFAYNLGKEYRPTADKIAKDRAGEKLAKTGKTPGEKGVYYRDKDGNATDIDTYLEQDKRHLNDLQKSGIEMMRKMSETMGIRFNVFETWVESGEKYYLDENGVKTKGDPNGFYDTVTGEIYIDLNAGSDYSGTMVFTIAHEVTHFMRQWSPEHFRKIAEIVYQHGEMKGSVSELVALKQANAKSKGKPISYDVALEEVVADGMETILKNGKVVQFMADVKQKDHSGWQKLKGWFMKLAKFLRAYIGKHANTVEGRKVSEFSKDLLSQIEQIYAVGAVEGGSYYQEVVDGYKAEQAKFSTANMQGGADGAVVQSDAAKAVVESASKKQMRTEFEALPKQVMSLSDGAGTLLHSIEGLTPTKLKGLSGRTVNGYTGRDVRAWAMGINGFTEAQIQEVNKFIGLQDVKDAKLHYTYNSDGSIKSIVLSAMVKNGDYPVNFDLSSICKKREAMSQLIDKLAKRGTLDNGTVKLTPGNIFRINTALKDAGYETACLGCFVESKRYNSLEWAKKFCNKWNAAVKKVNPNATYFGYGNATFNEDSFTLEQAIKIEDAANKYITATKTERLANALKKYQAKAGAGLPLVESFSKAAMDRLMKSETISDELKDKYLNSDVSTWNMADVEFLLENGVLPGASLSNKQAVTEMVKSGEAYQHLLRPSDLLTDRGISKLEALPNFHGVLYGHYGSGTPKLIQSYTPYNSEIALLPANKNKDQTLAEYLYTIAGVRMQSFSDFQIQNIYDYLQMVADLSARKLPAHAYTKEISFAKLLGMTGVKVNLSVMFDIDPMVDKAHAGLTKLNKLVHRGEYAKVILEDAQGKWVYNIGDYQTQKMFAEAFPDESKRFLQSIGFADAVKLQSSTGYSANCGIIGVGYSDLGIFAMLDDNRIRYIIPYHASSLPGEIKLATNIALGTDYTPYQNNMKVKEIVDRNGNKVDWSIKDAYRRLKSGQAVIDELNEKIRSEGWVVSTTKAQNGHGSYGLYEDLQLTNDPRQTANNFMDWCIGNGTLPLFYQFASHENYYKLLYDFNVYDCVTEEYAPQQAVTNTYPTMVDGQVQPGDVTDGGFDADYLKETANKQMAFMNAYNENRDADLEKLAENMEEGNYSLHSDRYSPEVLFAKDPLAVATFPVRDVPTKRKKVNLPEVVKEAKKGTGSIVYAVNKENPTIQSYVYISDIDSNVLVNTRGIVHGLQGNITNSSTMSTAEVEQVLPDVLRNSIAVNELSPRDEDRAKGIVKSYILFGYAKRADGKEYLVRSTINHFDGNKSMAESITIYDVLKGTKAKKMDSEVIGSHTGNPAASHLNTTKPIYTISVKDLLDIVKENYPEMLSNNFREYYGVTVPKADGLLFSDRDADGKQLTKEQLEFFSDSMVRDEDGNLLPVYHSTSEDFNTFEVSDASITGEFYYFAVSKTWSKKFHQEERYSDPKHIKKCYLNLTNVFDMRVMPEYTEYGSGGYYGNEWIKYIQDKGIGLDRRFVEMWSAPVKNKHRAFGGVPAWALIRYDGFTGLRESLIAAGYDGIVYYDKGRGRTDNTVYVAFHQNQIKLTSNKKPTTDTDTRFSNRDFLAQENLKSNYTVSEISEMFDAWNGDADTAALAKKVFTKLQSVQDEYAKASWGKPYDIRFVTQKMYEKDYFFSVNGMFEPSTGSKFYGITYNLDSFRKFDDQRKANIILHEAIHACTANYIKSAERRVPKHADVLTFKAGEDWSEESKAGLTLLQIFEQVRTAEERTEYGQKNAYEMTAELANPEFRNLLKKQRLWDRVVNAIKRILGIDTSTNALDAASKALDRILDTSDVRYQDRTEDSVSNRSLLANALEGVAKTDIERAKLKEYKDRIALLDEQEKKLRDLNAQIKELSFAKGPRDTKKISALRDEATKTANRIGIHDKKLLQLEASAPLMSILEREKRKAYRRAEQKGKEALDAYKEKTTKTQRELLDRWKESRKKAVESRERTVVRHKIQSVVGELNDLLLSNDKKRHVPDSLKKAVADALALVNMDTVGAEERAAKYAALIAKETDPDKIDAYTMTMENILRQGEKMGQRLKEMRDAYEEIQNSDDPDIANAYDPVIAGALKELSQTIGDTSLRNMTIEQLEDVYTMYKMVLTRVRDANKSFLNAKKESISNLASRVVGEVRRTGGEHKYRASILDPVRTFFWNNLKPVYAMEHIGSETMTDAFNNVRKGEDTWAKDVGEARAYYIDKSKKYGYDSWDFDKKYTFESTSGLEFELTLEQILSLYAYSKREQSHDHLRLGGFVFDSNIETYKDKGSKLLKYKVNTADAHQITPEILASITGTLTSDQMAFVDEMQDYLSTAMGAKGNEVTMAMYGVKLFKEKFYFPLKSAKQFMFEQNEVSGEVRIKNSGFTNKVVAKANNPVILSNFMDVWADHVNDMSMYHAFVLPLEDFNRIFNYNSPKQEGQPPVSVKGTIQSAYSPAAVSYVKQLITDLNGGARSDPRETIAKSLVARFKKAKVFASLSVVIQQPSAIGRAFALVDPKYFRPTVDGMNHDQLWAELKKYAPVAVIKEMGYFDVNMGKSTLDFIKAKEYTTFKEKAKAVLADSDYRDELLSKAPALADELSWCAIWNAVKRETLAKNPGLDIKSEPFLMLAGARFTEVITKTQVYDSVLARSANMRSKSGLMSMVTSFMAEPTTSINMLEDAFRKRKRGYKGVAGRVFASVALSVILNNALVSLVYGMRDDDEDETYAEKYMQAFVSGMIDDIIPLTYLPLVKDMWSVLRGYDIERSDMSLVSDLADALKSLVKAYTSEDGDVAAAWWTIAGAVANIGGIPMQNIRRDVNGAINLFNTIIEDTNGRSTTWGSMGDAIATAAVDTLPVVGWFPGETKADKLYDAIMSGDTDYVNRLKGSYKDDDAYHNAVRKALRENDPRITEAAKAQFNGDPSERVRIQKLIIADGFEQDDVVAATNTVINGMKPDVPEGDPKKKGFYTAEDFALEIANGDQASAYAIKVDIIQTAQKNGKSADDAEKSFKSSAKTELKELYLAGSISRDKVVNALVTYCGVGRDDAVGDIQYWDFKHNYPEIFADDAWIDEYYEEVESSGISLKVFVDYRNKVKGITGEGKKAKRMDVIHSMPISNAQKDALYFAEGWAESTLYEAPWH